MSVVRRYVQVDKEPQPVETGSSYYVLDTKGGLVSSESGEEAVSIPFACLVAEAKKEKAEQGSSILNLGFNRGEGMNEATMCSKLQSVCDSVAGLLGASSAQWALQHLYIAGGAIVSHTLGEIPADYDVWLDTQEVVDRYQARVNAPEPLPGAEVLAKTQNGITLKMGDDVIQIVTRFVGPPQRVFESFDFLHCMCYFQPAFYAGAVQEQIAHALVYDRDMIEKKQLRFNAKKEKWALNTLKRYGKFCSRGWTPDNETVVNLYRAIQLSPPIDDPAERQEQTIGFYGSSFE